MKYGREIDVSDHPMIFYFTGKYEVFRAQTVLVTISANHQVAYQSPGPTGIKVENKIYLDIKLNESATVEEAMKAVHKVLRFLEIMAGRRQSILQLVFKTEGAENRPNFLDVYLCMAPQRDNDAADSSPHPADLPIQAARTPESFATVLTAWLARDYEWSGARVRFSTAFSLQRSFTIDRLVGAANMFDILPAAAVPLDVELTKELRHAQTESRALFKSLPPTPERDSVLNAPNRLGKASLKRKVRARANLILDIVPIRFAGLQDVVDAAVGCRNHFVHGSKAKLDYTDRTDQVIFFTEALEFIFAASDLIDCGWDIKEWSQQGSTGSHSFCRFRTDFQPRVEELKRLLAVANEEPHY